MHPAELKEQRGRRFASGLGLLVFFPCFPDIGRLGWADFSSLLAVGLVEGCDSLLRRSAGREQRENICILLLSYDNRIALGCLSLTCASVSPSLQGKSGGETNRLSPARAQMQFVVCESLSGHKAARGPRTALDQAQGMLSCHPAARSSTLRLSSNPKLC